MHVLGSGMREYFAAQAATIAALHQRLAAAEFELAACKAHASDCEATAAESEAQTEAFRLALEVDQAFAAEGDVKFDGETIEAPSARDGDFWHAIRYSVCILAGAQILD